MFLAHILVGQQIIVISPSKLSEYSVSSALIITLLDDYNKYLLVLLPLILLPLSIALSTLPPTVFANTLYHQKEKEREGDPSVCRIKYGLKLFARISNPWQLYPSLSLCLVTPLHLPHVPDSTKHSHQVPST